MPTIYIIFKEGCGSELSFTDTKDTVYDYGVGDIGQLTITEQVKLVPNGRGFEPPRALQVYAPGTWTKVYMNYAGT